MVNQQHDARGDAALAAFNAQQRLDLRYFVRVHALHRALRLGLMAREIEKSRDLAKSPREQDQ